MTDDDQEAKRAVADAMAFIRAEVDKAIATNPAVHEAHEALLRAHRELLIYGESAGHTQADATFKAAVQAHFASVVADITKTLD